MRDRLSRELRAYLIIAAYLYVWLVALRLYETALLREQGVAALPLGLEVGKALILGKFVLLGEAAGVGSRVRARTLAERIAWRALALVVLLVVLSGLEELVVGWVHGRSAAQTIAALETRPMLELASECLLMLLVLVPFVAVKQVSLALGPGVLRRLLFERRVPTGD